MQDQNSLADFLDDEGADQTAIAQPEPQAVEPPPQDQGVKAEAVPPPGMPAQEAPEGDYIPKKAHLEERRKRQEAERRLKELEDRLNHQPQHVEPPSWDMDPQSAAAQLHNQFAMQLFETKVATSEMLMRERHQDYDDIVAEFSEQARANPALIQQMMQHPSPAKFAYETGRQLRLMTEIGTDPEAYKAKLREQILAELGQSPTPKADTKPAAPVPRSLARDVSQQPRNNRGQYDGPPSLSELID